MGNDKKAEKAVALETVANGLKKFLVEFEVKQSVITSQVVEATTFTFPLLNAGFNIFARSLAPIPPPVPAPLIK